MKAEIHAPLIIEGGNPGVSKCEREGRQLFPNARCSYLDETSLDKLKGQQRLLLKSLRQDGQVFGDMTVVGQMHGSQHLSGLWVIPATEQHVACLCTTLDEDRIHGINSSTRDNHFNGDH